MTDLSHPQPSPSPEEEENAEEATSNVHAVLSAPPRGVDVDDEKDAQDHLTPAALVHAASGIPLQRLQNASDLKDDKGGDDTIVEQLDEALASVPPTLERRPAVPSQPGAFRAGGGSIEEDTVASAPAAAVVEATLVVEAAPVAPIYKGQIVEDDVEHGVGDNVVTLPKRQVRCFLVAFGLVCLVAIVLSVTLSVAELDGNKKTPDDGQDKDPSSKGYWHEETPEQLWNMIQNRSHITHHMALVSIVHPKNSTTVWTKRNDTNGIEEEEENAIICAPWRDDKFESRNAISGDTNRRNRDLEGRDDTVIVSFTCGKPQEGEVPEVDEVPFPDAVLVMHDGNARALNGRDIQCRDSMTSFHDGRNNTLKYNEVFCEIPNDADPSNNGLPLAFFFSCFARFEQNPVASVHTHVLSAPCRWDQNRSSSSTRLPDEATTEGFASVVLSTQRLCRDPSNDEIVLQSRLVEEDWQSSMQNCSLNWGNDDDNRLVCQSNETVLLATASNESAVAVPLCDASNDDCLLELQLPNVTLYDTWDDDTHQCFYETLEESLIVPEDDHNTVPKLPLPSNNATWEEWRHEQEEWVEFSSDDVG